MAVKKTETPSIDKKKVEAIKESFLRNRKSLTNQVLFFITTVFSLWVFADLVLWANEEIS